MPDHAAANRFTPPRRLSSSAPDEVLPGLAQLIASELAPRVLDIDLKGVYPEAFLRQLGAFGGYAGHVAPEFGGMGTGLGQTIRVMEEVAKLCLSTSFLVWCQSACAGYLQQSDNGWLKANVLPALASGRLLAGTGLSNPMKSCAAIEPIRLKAIRTADGYTINGTLPWLSNLGPDHYFAVGAGVEGKPGFLIALVRGDQPGLSLNQGARFVALEGTRTFACRFRNVVVPDSAVICHPDDFAAFVARIKPGFVLSQMGMVLGLVGACVELMRESDKSHSHVNCFLDDRAEHIAAALAQARATTYSLAKVVDAEGGASVLRDVLELRVVGSKLALKAAQAAMLHLGARGYLMTSPGQRRWREACFVAIVTPALKHLRKELADMDHASRGGASCCA